MAEAAGERIERPWGWFETLADGPDYRIKRLRIRAGRRLSLQRHAHRSEHWVVVAGEGWLECAGECVQAWPGSTLLIPTGAIHRATAGHLDLEFVEVQRGADLREDDIERLEDDYGRAPESIAHG